MSQRNRDLYIVYIISYLDLFAVGLTIPLLSNHLRDLGFSHFVIGLLSSLYSGLQVFFGPIIGSWSDVRGRKTVLTVTLLISSLGYVLMGTTKSLSLIIFTRILLGISKHTQSICKAIITDLLPENERAGAFGTSAAWGSLGFIIGPTLGGHLSELNSGFFYVCVFTSILFLTNIALACALNEVRAQAQNGAQDGHLSKFRQELRKSLTDITQINWKSLWDIFLLRFIFGFAVTMFFSQQSLYLKSQFELSQRHIGYTISYFSATGMISAFLLRYITKSLYENDSCLKRLTHFFSLMTISLVALVFAPSIQIYLVFMIPFSLSCTVLRIVSMELMLKQASSSHRGSLSGTSNSIMSVSRFLTPMTSGLLTDRLGLHVAMCFAAVPPLVGTFVALKIKKKIERKEKSA